jgi:hypothetical protein
LTKVDAGRLDPFGNACSLAEVLEQLLHPRRRQRAIVAARPSLEADEDAITRHVAWPSSVNVLLQSTGKRRNRDEALAGLASYAEIEVAIRLMRS